MLISSCFFHFTQNLYKHVQSEALVSEFSKRGDFYVIFRNLQTLAFLPVNDVVYGFDFILSRANGKFPVHFKYFENNYIGELKTGSKTSRKSPRFEIEFWNKQ